MTSQREMHPGFRIRRGEPADAKRLAVLATQVWLHTYCTDGINEPVAQYVLSELTPDKFLQSLNEPATHILVAEQGENLLGFAAVKVGAACPVDTGSAVELQTLYVQEHHVGRGVGKALIHAAESLARELAEAPLWLTVNAKNDRAIGFYARRGYAKVGTTYFVLGEGRHENHVLVGP